jgi:hypothetical protein
MSSVALLLLQAATAVAPPAPAPDDRLLHPVPPPAHCDRSSTDIVVCAKDQDTYRLPKTGPEIDEPLLPKAEWKIFGNAKASVGTSQRNVGGFPSNAVMATIKIPF